MAPGWPIDVENGLAALGRGFDNAPQGQRSALTLANGKLYVPYAGHYGDCGAYYGMVVGFNLATPAVFGAWSTQVGGGGSWGQSGVAFDGGSLFATTGNGFGSSSSWGGSEAVFRLPPTLSNPTHAADYFAPKNWYALDQADLDLGGTSAIPIDVPVSPVIHRVLALGKDGNAYLLNRANLGGIGGQIATARVSTNEIITAMATYPGSNAAMVAFEGAGADCPSGQSGNLVMLEITASAIATVWCASFNGSGAPIVTTTDGGRIRLSGSPALKATASFMGSAGPTVRGWWPRPAAAPLSRNSRPLCGPTAAFTWLPTARSTPSCIKASSGGGRPAATRVHNAEDIRSRSSLTEIRRSVRD